jgi:hypothetical protein
LKTYPQLKFSADIKIVPSQDEITNSNGLTQIGISPPLGQTLRYSASEGEIDDDTLGTLGNYLTRESTAKTDQAVITVKNMKQGSWLDPTDGI